jgi:hypothetical protein
MKWVCDTWFVVCGLWYVVRGMWFVVCGSWYVVRDVGFVELGSWYVVRDWVRDAWFVMLGLLSAQFVVCSVCSVLSL